MGMTGIDGGGMDAFNGFYFFAMPSGEYSDYRVSGFWAGVKPITEEEWESFMREQIAVRSAQRAAMIIARRGDDDEEFHKQYRAYRDWLDAQGSIESMFAAKHSLVKLGYEEFNLDN